MLDIGIINTYSRKKLTKKQKIRDSKFYSGLPQVDEGATKKCLICGKEITSYCKSHSIPKFVLRNIAKNGELRTGKMFFSDSYQDKSGVGNTLTFYSICDNCDNTFFQEYEKEETFYKSIDDVSINKIAIKSYLRYLYKQKSEVIKYKFIIKNNLKHIEDKPFYENQLLLSKINVSDTESRIDRLLKKCNEHNFYIIDEIDLDYQTENGYQGFITLIYGFDGVVNNVYNYNSSYKIQDLGVCVFPHKKGTKILLFCEDGASRMKYFYKYYKKLNLDQKLYVINYILLLYEEEWVVDNEFHTILNKETLKLINQHDVYYQEADNKNEFLDGKQLLKEAYKYYKLKVDGSIYNFLTPKMEK